MRESIGVLSIFSIVMTFIVLFVSYLAVSINYANAFRVKNNLISAIENREGIANTDVDVLNDLLVNQRYDTFGKCPTLNDLGGEWLSATRMLIGEYNGKARACIYKREVSSSGGLGSNVKCPIAYYKVIVFFKMDLPVLGDLLSLPVKGDTRGVYDRISTDCVETA